MPVQKGGKLTYLNSDSVSVTELAKLGKCERLIKVDTDEQTRRKGIEEHTLFNEECRYFMGTESDTWNREKILSEDRFRRNLGYLITGAFFILFLGILAGYWLHG